MIHMKTKQQKLAITPIQSLTLLSGYARKKLSEQTKAVSFIMLYLIGFQLMILVIPLSNPIKLLVGLTAVVLGLAFFLEGLFLSVMPLAEMAGAELPTKTKLPTTLMLAFSLGILATLAEPAMVVLKEVTNFIPMHKAPLLYYLFNEKNMIFVITLGLGVGFAMILGSLQSLKNFSLKILIVILVILALILSILAYIDPRSRPMVALSWDAGGIATGAVTVPLIIAFGLGISRVTGDKNEANGLGIITLANLSPVNALLILSLILRTSVPMPTEDLSTFLEDSKASVFLQEQHFSQTSEQANILSKRLSFFIQQFKAAITAVGPLVLILTLIIFAIIRKRPSFIDEKILGIVFSIIGMFFLNYGIQTGLNILGRDVGSHVYTIIKPEETPVTIISNFSPSNLEYFSKANGEMTAFFKLVFNDKIQYIPFEEKRYNSTTKEYYLKTNDFLLQQQVAKTWGKLFLFFMFFIFLGFGAVVAEPTLHALATTLSEMTAGSFPKAQLVRQVAMGVGVGLAIGVARMMLDIPFLFMLLPLYIIALILTLFSENTYTAIAWDAAGVSTGPITVPLVITVGLGINQFLGSSEQFGFLTLGATIPILILLTISLKTKIRQNRIQKEQGNT